jgi:phosphoribosylaminoimidazole-succinocarboxamide synthase
MLSCDLPGIPKLRSGKVREVFDLGAHLLLVATDRISAFDCILPDPIPGKGRVLNTLSAFWFAKLDFVANHVVETNVTAFPASLAPFRELLDSRAMVVRKTQPLPVECVARGYLAGSGFEEYRRAGTVGGHQLPGGLELADQLPAPLFTPARKAEAGHDENLTWRQFRALVGDDLSVRLRDLTLELYEHGRAHAATRGILLADTKFEFGLLDGELLLIDECLTPDSSRFWPADSVKRGQSPPSFDKQFVRDHLSSLDWDKTPPAPQLPPDIIERTAQKYQEALTLLTAAHRQV